MFLIRIFYYVCVATPSVLNRSCRRLRAGWGGGEMLSANAGRKDSHPSPFCYFSPPSHRWYFLSFFFQHLAHLNGWSSPYSSASFDIWWSPNGPSAHVLQYKKQQQQTLYVSTCEEDVKKALLPSRRQRLRRVYAFSQRTQYQRPVGGPASSQGWGGGCWQLNFIIL